jgi:phytoene synthase
LEDDDLDDLIRRVDPDRWLASRFIGDPVARADVIALYAFNYEISRAAEVASQPLIGEMRLAWWREVVEETFAGAPMRRHPAAEALAGAVRRHGLPREALEAMIEARRRDLEAWPLNPAEVEPYVDATAGGLMALAARALARNAEPNALRHAGRAWGLAGLFRLGRLPAEWSADAVSGLVREALGRSKRDLAALPVAAFPAAAYATLSRAYVSGANLGELGRKARITAAVAFGRL